MPATHRREGTSGGFAATVKGILQNAGVHEHTQITAKDLRNAIVASSQKAKGKDSTGQPEQGQNEHGKDTTEVKSPQKSEDIEDIPSSSKETGPVTDVDEKGDDDVLGSLLAALDIGPDDHVSANDIIELSESLAKGQLPKPELALDKKTLKNFEEASLLDKIRKYPRETFEYVKFHVLLNVSERGTQWIKSLVPYHQLQTLVLVYIFTLITKSFLLAVVPLLIFYICIFSMTIFTLQMFYGRRLSAKINNIGSILKTIDPLEKSSQEQDFRWDAKRPYLGFIVCCVLAAVMLPLCDMTFIPTSQFCIISFFFTVTTLRAHSTSLGKLEMVKDTAVALLLVLRCLSYYGPPFSTPIIKVYSSEWVHVVLSTGAAFEGIVVITIAAVAIFAAGKGKDASLGVIMSALISLFWFQMGLQLFMSSTWKGIFQITLGWILVIVAFPMLVIYILLQAGYVAVMAWASFSISAKVVIALAVITFTTAGLIYTRFKNSSIVWLLLGCFGVLLCLACSLFLFTASHYTSDKAKLPLEEYCSNCFVDTGIGYNAMKKQMACSKYVGKGISWTGVVQSSSASLVENTAMSVIGTFPYWLQSTLKCVFGTTHEKEIFQAILTNRCHLSKYNRYTISLTTTSMCPPYGNGSQKEQNVVLTSDDSLLKYMKHLSHGSEIVFNATLVQGLGTSSVVADLHSLHFKNQTAEFEEDESLTRVLLSAVIKCFQFFIGPVIFIHE